MTEKTFNTRARAAGMAKSTIAYKELHALLSGSKEESRPDTSTKRGVRVYTGTMMIYGRRMGLGVERGNDSPRGGVAGNFVKLTAKGKKQMFNR